MKKLLTTLAVLFALSPLSAQAVNVTVPSSPGLGSVLYGKANGNYTTLTVGANGDCLKVTLGVPAWGSCGTGGGGGTDGNWAFFNGSGIRLATTTNQVLIGASSTTTRSALEVIGGIFANASSTINAGLTVLRSTSTNATSTSLAISSLTSELLKVNAVGAVLEAVSGTDYEVPLTFGDGLTRTANDVDVDTTQNIAILSNLTSNGFVKTSGGNGTLSVDTNTYLTGNQTITLSGDVSGSGSTAITTAIGSNKVTVGMLAQAAANTVLGNPTGSTANIQAIATSSLFQNASASVTGLLSSTDWSTFNNKQAAGNYITALTGDVTASGPGSAGATLATVNSNVGSFTNANVTVNAKGLVTAVSSGSGGGGSGNVATSAPETAGQLTYFTSTNGTPATIAGTPTTTVSCSGDASCTPFTVIGSSPITINSTGGAGGSWATTSETYYWSQFRDWSILNGYLRPTTTLGVLISASSTIGSGLNGGGLTVSGTATTTGTTTLATLGGNVGIGTSSPAANLSITGRGNQGNQPLFIISSSTAAFATTTKLIVDSQGRVAINPLGTNPLNAQFNVFPKTGSGISDDLIRFFNTGGSQTVGINASGVYTGINIDLNPGSGATGVNVNQNASGIGYNITAPAAATANMVRIQKTGRGIVFAVDRFGQLTIGSSTPSAMLSITSSSTASTTLSLNAFSNQTADILQAWRATNTKAFVIQGNGYVGISSSTPFTGLSIGIGNGSSTHSILVAEHRPATSTAITVDWKMGNTQNIRLGSAAMTISFSNFTDGATLKVLTCNPPTGTAGAVTWGTQVLWSGGTVPTQTTTAQKCDVWSFIATQATSTLKIFGTHSPNF